MSNPTLEGMARAICLAIWDHDYTPRDTLHPDARWVQAMKAAKAGAGFLAGNVSDEMADVVALATMGEEFKQHPEEGWNEWMRRLRKVAIAAALRAAAGGGE